jgi:hypothetical protein
MSTQAQRWTVNDVHLSYATKDADLVLRVEPICTPHALGGQLVDEKGEVRTFQAKRRDVP